MLFRRQLLALFLFQPVSAQWLTNRPFLGGAIDAVANFFGLGDRSDEDPPNVGNRGVGGFIGDALSGGVSRAVDDSFDALLDNRSCNDVAVVTDRLQLEDMSGTEYRCLFSRGVAPRYMPLGFGYGTPLNIAASDVVSRIAGDIWGGKIFMRMWCNRRTLDFRFIQNLVKGQARFPARVYIDKNRYASELAPIDFIDDNPSMWIDYTGDFSDCQSEDALANQAMTSEFMANRYPINQIVDEVRLIGSSERTGADIYLGRALFRFGDQYRNVAWWSLEIFDTQEHYNLGGRLLGPDSEDIDFESSEVETELEWEKCVVDPEGEFVCPDEGESG